MNGLKCINMLLIITIALPSLANPQTPNCNEIPALEAVNVLLHAMRNIDDGIIIELNNLKVKTVCKRIDASATEGYAQIATYIFSFTNEFANDSGKKLLITEWETYFRGDRRYVVKIEETEVPGLNPPMIPRPVSNVEGCIR